MSTHPHATSRSIWDRTIVRGAIGDALRKLHPRTMAKNPVMFVVEAGSVLTTVRFAIDAAAGRPGLGFELQITFWLWLTVLFANFAEAMAEGRGKAQAPAGGTITVAAAVRGDEVAFSVADTGSGIPRDYLNTIFEPFVQVPHASGGGAGLDLPISRRIVEGHGGRLTVQSEPGRGSTFTFPVRPDGERPHP